MTGATLQLDRLSVGWEGVPVLSEVTLSINAGETLALLGQSGSGKSTLLRSIAGLTPCLAGRVLIDDADVTDVPTHLRGVGMVFQGHALFPQASVIDNVAYGPRMRGLSRSESRTEAQVLLARVGLESFGPRDVATLSGGQRQRVALARTLAAEPAVVLLDEPLGALDAGLRASLLVTLREVFAQADTTVVHVTHDPVEAAVQADKIAVVHDGGIAQIGTPSNLYLSPASAVVAELMGHPNVLDAVRLGLSPNSARPTAVVPFDAITLVSPDDASVDVVGTVVALAPGPTWTVTVALDDATMLTTSVDPHDAPTTLTRVGLRLERSRVVRVAGHRGTSADGAAGDVLAS